jgi:hypothetical protein
MLAGFRPRARLYGRESGRREFAVAFLALAFCSASGGASTNGVFNARLSPVSMDATMRANIAGSGTASAVLDGSKLNVTGSFEGLLSPATTAQIRRGSATGVRGVAILTLTIPQALNGKFAGSFDLNPEQMESLQKGRLYVQIASEKAPDGNLWGWLLP